MECLDETIAKFMPGTQRGHIAELLHPALIAHKYYVVFIWLIQWLPYIHHAGFPFIFNPPGIFKPAGIHRIITGAGEAGARQPELLADRLFLLMDGAYMAARMFGPENPAAHVAAAAQILIDAALT